MIFISYSHEDFEVAERLAKRLNDLGQDVWYDQWEIQVGDSLVQKIFNEGLGKAKAFLVLLSRHSVESAWVREELDHATIRRINGVTRIVPVLIDDAVVPVNLRTLKWVDFRRGFDEGVQSIVNAIEGVTTKPERRDRPEYITRLPASVGGLSRAATALGLHLLSSVNIDADDHEGFSGKELAESLGLPPEQLNDAVDELKEYGLVQTVDYMGTAPFEFGFVTLTYALFVHFADALDYSPEEDIKTVINAVAALGDTDGLQLQAHTQLSPGRINRAVGYLKDYGLADVIQWMGTHPFTFGAISATRQTRQAAGEK